MIDSSRKQLEGLLYARFFNGFYESAKVDLTLVAITGDYGRCDENGVNHTGAYRTLLINETNLGTIILDNLQCDDLKEIEVGPLQLDHEQTIASMKAPKMSKQEMTADFTEIFKTVDYEIYLLFLIASLIVFDLWSKRGKRENKLDRKRKKRERAREANEFVRIRRASPKVAWNMTAITFNQFNGNPKNFNLRLIVLIYILIIFWIFQFLFASFTSDLAIERPVQYIDSLLDLANSKEYTAVFIEEYNAWRRFQESKDPIAQKVRTLQNFQFIELSIIRTFDL